MFIDTSKIMYEDDLPPLSDAEYDIWYKLSWVDIVRVGYFVTVEKVVSDEL